MTAATAALALEKKNEPVIDTVRLRLRAYQLYEKRGEEDGHELDDWLQAEAEFKEALPT